MKTNRNDGKLALGLALVLLALGAVGGVYYALKANRVKASPSVPIVENAVSLPLFAWANEGGVMYRSEKQPTPKIFPLRSANQKFVRFPKYVWDGKRLIYYSQQKLCIMDRRQKRMARPEAFSRGT